MTKPRPFLTLPATGAATLPAMLTTYKAAGRGLHTLTGWLFLLGLLLGINALAPAAAPVKLDVELANPVVLSRGPQRTYLRVALTGMRPGPKRRVPVNTAIVLDRSGSMAGNKLEEAKRAAILALDRLDDNDTLSVVVYGSTVEVLVPATQLRERDHIRRAIQRIQSTGSTALFAGLSKGAAQVRRYLDENRVNNILLLSDGLANVGPSSPAELEQLGRSLGREGITVTTIGLGLHYNEDLMMRVAMASDGNHFFVEEAQDLEAAFATEFGDALSTVAQGVNIRLRCPAGVRPIRVLGREATISGQTVQATINQIYQDQTRYLLLEVEVTPGSAGASQPVADVDVEFRDLVAKNNQQLQGGARVSYTASASEVESKKNREVLVSVASQVAAERNKVAAALREEGKIEEAKKAYQANAVYLKQEAKDLAAPALATEAAVADEAEAAVTNDVEWNRSRKVQMESTNQVIQQRAPKAAAPKKRPE